MAKRKPRTYEPVQARRSKKAKVLGAESLKRVSAFDLRKEAFVAAIRKGKDRSMVGGR
jgi:hypothetical protein